MFELDISTIRKLKLGIHIAQGLITFVTWAIEIALFRSAAQADGRRDWYFGLCFLNIPAIIYLTMTPLFPRSQKLAAPYAFAVVDSIFAILWLSAFASMASYNSAGKCNPDCGIAKAMVGLGFFIFFFFAVTAAMSIYGLNYYRRNGSNPWISSSGSFPAGSGNPANDPDKDAFSTAPHGEAYAPLADENDHDDHDDLYHNEATTFGGAGSNHGYESHSYNNNDTSYHGASGYAPPRVEVDHHDDYGHGGHGEPERVQFPPANYDSVPVFDADREAGGR